MHKSLPTKKKKKNYFIERENRMFTSICVLWMESDHLCMCGVENSQLCLCSVLGPWWEAKYLGKVHMRYEER